MNAAPLVHLAWKEYRVARAFWVSIVALVLAAEALVVWWLRVEAFSDERIAVVVCNLALGAPVFFALGCAGAAFAVEREEGTFGFLRAAPVSARQVLVAKLGVTVLATLAMFALLWPLALLFTGGRLPETATLNGMLGLWLLAAVEAIAWGTLFSLLTARPLAAICLALVAASSVAHLFAWSVAQGPGYEFAFAHYLRAALWRAVVVALVLAVDVYLSLRWLDEGPVARRSMHKTNRKKEQGGLAMASRPERTAIRSHLLWQHFRQSGRLMLLLAAVQIALVGLARHGGLVAASDAGTLPLVPLAAMAAVMGSCVFLADQERHRFRFFVEHNVPPRAVWVTRQLPWIGTVVLSSLVACIIWVWPTHRNAVLVLVREPYSIVGIVFGVTMTYAAGQWTSMMIRSGLLAGALGILLAGLLCGWTALMVFLGIPWWWSIAPIPVVLLGATWLRAPDWVRENTTLTARTKAAATVLAPALALCILMPYYRVHEIPLESPGFDVARYEADIPSDGAKTAALYRRANELLVPRRQKQGTAAWLGENAEPLELLLEASRRPNCLLDDPRKDAVAPPLWNASEMVRLLIASAEQLQAEGQSDEALDRYFAALRMLSHWTENNATRFSFLQHSSATLMMLVLDQIPKWATREGQSVEHLRRAIARLNGLDANQLHDDEGLKAAYLVMHRIAMGDTAAAAVLFGDEPGHPGLEEMFLYQTLLPWEKYRETRSLNRKTHESLARLAFVRKCLAHGNGIVDETAPSQLYFYYRNAQTPFQIAPMMPYMCTSAVSEMVQLEDCRRATTLLVALVAYRLDHGELPPSLEALVETYLDKLPVDPYSGRDFVYFRDGLPPPATDLETVELKDAQRQQAIVPGVPCIWSTSAKLVALQWSSGSSQEDAGDSDEPVVYYRPRGGYTSNSDYATWALGHWFPIPELKEASP